MRHIKRTSIKALKGVPLPSCPALDMEHVYHRPGQSAAIRFFDTHSVEDYEAMRDIIKGKHVKKWMDDASNITKSDYQDWAGTHTNSQFLFAVLDARASTVQEIDKVRGFIYIYSERSEKYRAKRMERLGFLKPAIGMRHSLEVSFAMRPISPGMHSGSGLISSALRQSCLQVQMLLESPGNPEIVLFGFVDLENYAAQRTLEAAGFTKRGLMLFDNDSDEKKALYILDWAILEQKVRQKLIEQQ